MRAYELLSQAAVVKDYCVQHLGQIFNSRFYILCFVRWIGRRNVALIVQFNWGTTNNGCLDDKYISQLMRGDPGGNKMEDVE